MTSYDEKKSDGQLQIHLITKQAQFAVPDVPVSIQSNVTSKELNNLLNTLLCENTEFTASNIEFDFLVKSEFLKTSLGKHLRDRDVSFEDIVEIEYVERFPAPEPQDCLLHDDWVSAIQANGEWILTGSYDNSVNVWNMKGDHKLTLSGHEAPIKGVTWISVNEDTGMALFASGSKDQTIMIWEWNIGSNKANCIYICKGHERAVECVSVSPNGKQIASGGWDNFLKIWSATTLDDNSDVVASNKKPKTEEGNIRTPQMTLEGHREAVSSCTWIDNSTVLTSSWDHTMKIWDLNMRAIKNEVPGNKSFFDASYSNLNGMIVAASADKNIRLFDPRSNQGVIVKSTFFGHNAWVQSVCWSKTEEFLFISGAYDNQVKLWDYRSPKAPLFDLVGHEDKVMAVDWSNPKYMLSGGADNTLRIFKSKKVLEE
ncbi:CLUMA_CG014360, isoform A [Clunio marinus]|uniref:Ribosome biogenesis protein WDR12 homolog n=1 Tax=Clunio marinus TaxID=568069 RepID=A0A1J1IMX4_9DIPT|nr:CLUMA_CG014360, isoform A [Clunio marinus]